MTSALVYAIYLIVAVLYVYALVDCIRTPVQRIRMLPKAGWLIIMVLFPILGAIAWRNLGRRSASAGDRVSAA
ncbi:PLD nuclease N-terminal domain-containing protein [Streptomyces sp. JH14]|uniref:PLD nuclease N-terminal domain-containing protein n=1 Tax=Streptomyces sp. JH14 TaxID=2793630 RepID=UPI0023F68AEB|nr:PLD nuclease N-terminal domain-containing protein [Streptomyces sp. JH14]MDF6042277.1 PLD nuclease N-terminal domain-containing protein [Streptomyces sp. JH14]